MAELRGSSQDEQATVSRPLWIQAYTLYRDAPVARTEDAKADRTERISHVVSVLGITRKQAKRRIKNYDQWRRNVLGGRVPRTDDFVDLGGTPPGAPVHRRPAPDRGGDGGGGYNDRRRFGERAPGGFGRGGGGNRR